MTSYKGRGGFTCKSEGSGTLAALVPPGVTVTWLDRDERRLRAEEGRDDDRLSEGGEEQKHLSD